MPSPANPLPTMATRKWLRFDPQWALVAWLVAVSVAVMVAPERRSAVDPGDLA